MGRAPDVQPVGDVSAGDVVRVLDGPLDLRALDGLARLLLAVRRGGGRLFVRGPVDADVLGLVGLALQPLREPEAGEQLGVQEVVHVRDLTA